MSPLLCAVLATLLVGCDGVGSSAYLAPVDHSEFDHFLFEQRDPIGIWCPDRTLPARVELTRETTGEVSAAVQAVAEAACADTGATGCFAPEDLGDRVLAEDEVGAVRTAFTSIEVEACSAQCDGDVAWEACELDHWEWDGASIGVFAWEDPHLTASELTELHGIMALVLDGYP